jgi:peptidoglycan/xylan/chitin deacetylase (PgdA/CDA1 family)
VVKQRAPRSAWPRSSVGWALGEIGSLLRTEALQRLRKGSIIVGYHGVGRSSFADDPYLLQVRPERFRLHMETLLAAGFRFVTMADFAGRMTGDRDLPTGYAVVTFDDGMQDNHEHALPILSEYAITATVYVLAGAIGQPNPWMSRDLGLRMMNESELRDLVAAGWELGAHSVTHPDMSSLSYQACLREMLRSKTAVEQLAGVVVQTFAYPFGSHGPAAVAAARDAGFTAAVSTGEAVNSRYALRRAMIGGADAFPVAFLKAVAVSQPVFAGRRVVALRRRIAMLRSLRNDVRRRRFPDAWDIPPVSWPGPATDDAHGPRAP